MACAEEKAAFVEERQRTADDCCKYGEIRKEMPLCLHCSNAKKRGYIKLLIRFRAFKA